MCRTTGSEKSAFTLLELLVVMAIAVAMMVFFVGALSDVLRAGRITQAAQTIVDAINLARETAVARNNVVEVVFKKEARDGVADQAYFQRVLGRVVAKDGTKTEILCRHWLPEGTLISTVSGLSSMLDETLGEGIFRIRPNGELETVTGAGNHWFVTVVAFGDKDRNASALRNFATIQINPFTARTFTHRP